MFHFDEETLRFLENSSNRGVEVSRDLRASARKANFEIWRNARNLFHLLTVDNHDMGSVRYNDLVRQRTQGTAEIPHAKKNRGAKKETQRKDMSMPRTAHRRQTTA